MPAARHRATARLGFALLLVAALLASWGFWYRLDRFPAYLDFDSATLGIFVNNVSFHDRYDHFFGVSPVDQDRYRADWAAQFLPAATVLSAVQTGLSIPPDRVGDLLEVVALLLAALGLGAVAWTMRRRGATVEETLFVAALTASLPPFLLFLRTTQPHFLFSFAMFWIAVAAIDRYLATSSGRALLVLALAMALYAQLPYVPLVVLPVVGVLMAASRGKALASVRDVRLYGAAAFSAGLIAVMQVGVALRWETSWHAWWDKASAFIAARSRHAWPGFDPETFADKATKLFHQHFWFQRDALGDRTRNDHLWTLPEPHVAWLLVAPLVLVGLWAAWRRRDALSPVFAAVLLPTYALSLTVGFPEGRYLMTAVPALAWFVVLGLRTLAGSRASHALVMAAILVAMTVNSWILVRGDYSEIAMRRWSAMAGLRETVDLVQREFAGEIGRSRDLHLAWPGLRYEAWLYAQMLGNLRVQPFGPNQNLAALAPGEPLFAAVEVGAEQSPQMEKMEKTWRQLGFREAGRVIDAPSGREFMVLVLAP